MRWWKWPVRKAHPERAVKFHQFRSLTVGIETKDGTFTPIIHGDWARPTRPVSAAYSRLSLTTRRDSRYTCSRVGARWRPTTRP